MRKIAKLLVMLLVVVMGITTIKLDASASNTASTLATPQFTLTNTANGVTVNWDFVNNATGYIVYRREPSGVYRKVAGFTDGKTKSYTDKTVVNGEKYYYAVKAINAQTQSKYNNKLITYASSITTPQFTLTNTANGIKIDWNLISNAAGYIVYRREGNGTYQKVAGFTDGVTKSYVDTTVVSGKTYNYAVKAINGSVQSTYVSKSITFATNLTTPKFTLTNTSAGVKIDWNLVSNATGYIVYRRQGNDVFQKIAGFTDGVTKSYIDKTAVSGTKYSYAVKAINGSVQSKYLSKDVVCAKSLITPQFTLACTEAGVKIDWNMVSGATGYIVYRREGNEAFKKVAGFTDGITQSYEDKNVVNGTEYYYAVKAINGSVQSAYTSKSIAYAISEELFAYRAQVVEIINQERRNAGVREVIQSEALDAVAQIRAKEIVESFSHTRPNGTSCFTVLGENGIWYSTDSCYDGMDEFFRASRKHFEWGIRTGWNWLLY